MGINLAVVRVIHDLCPHHYDVWPSWLFYRRPIAELSLTLTILPLKCFVQLFWDRDGRFKSLLHFWNVNSNRNSGKPSQFLQDVLFIGAVYYKRRNQSTTAALCPKRMCFRCLTPVLLCGPVVSSSAWVLEFYRNYATKMCTFLNCNNLL
jgi:hypothetical protein